MKKLLVLCMSFLFAFSVTVFAADSMTTVANSSTVQKEVKAETPKKATKKAKKKAKKAAKKVEAPAATPAPAVK